MHMVNRLEKTDKELLDNLNNYASADTLANASKISNIMQDLK